MSWPAQGMDCLPQFKLFQECLGKHPEHIARLMEDPEVEAATAAEQQQQQAGAKSGGSGGDTEKS